MHRKKPRACIIVITAVIFIYWLPFICISISATQHIAEHIDKVPESDAIIIFGTIVRGDGQVSPLLKERLEAGITLMEKGKGKRIVVSDMGSASGVMASYLYRMGIDPDIVEIDTEADNTPDTCRFEKKHHGNRKIIFVSQGFHLPRILYQCGKTGTTGTAFPAGNVRADGIEKDSVFTVIKVRLWRYTREAALTWMAFLGIYK